MAKYKLAFVAFDSAKEKHAVAIAEDGRYGEVRYFGEVGALPSDRASPSRHCNETNSGPPKGKLLHYEFLWLFARGSGLRPPHWPIGCAALHSQ
jgi:hypothetical protein